MAEVLQTVEPNVMPGGSPGKKKGGKGKRMSIERIYQKKTQREHILIRPDAYIGTVESDTKQMWVWDDKSNSIKNKEITFCPGLYKIFDEVLVNAADNKQRDPTMNTIKITIDVEKNVISIWNNGKGIPIIIHKEENVYVPTLIFGQLLTSSNYDDTQKKVTGGRNGFGAKLCNIFSTNFVVETACGEYGKKFKQVWKNNMTKTDNAKITDFNGTDFTCVTFQPDLPRFHMEKLSDDMVSLLKRRAYDIAGASKGITVLLNGQKLNVKNFRDYVDLYLKGSKKSEDGEDAKIVHEVVNPRWEICVTVSDHGFQQASFVNSIATTKGGSHVNYLVDQIVAKMMTTVKRKASKDLTIRPFQIKNHLWVFVNCLIENPAFDSQTKENMTLNQKSFGSKCELNEKFIKLVQGCGVLDSIMSWVKFKTQEKMNSKCSSSKRVKIKGIPKLDDANDAGGAKSRDCTLILTEGDSAKTLAISGLGVIGRDKYGVFPLRGKLLNVRDASSKQIMENAEITSIVKIVGLQYRKKYNSVDDLKTLRYGHIMIMADQDQDGSHIKGLLINFIHHNWPSLLQMPFLEEFITPIVKVSKSGQSLSFFSLPELEEWRTNTANPNSWKVKYYKGLGTSTSKEAKEYFSDMKRHRIEFDYDGPSSDQAIEMAFSKKMVPDRKLWLTSGMEDRKRRRLLGMPEIYLYRKGTTSVSFSDFVHKELILFSNADNERSIPSMVDGFKPGQRKVLFTCMKRNDKREVKVAQLAGSIAELSAYHHGETSLMGTVINLAQNYVGSNNINLLQPLGQFGTRINGGKDSASPRYIFTMLSSVTRLIFPEKDDPLLNTLFDDGTKIEPEWYCPIIPMVLVNGADGIGTGWSTKVPNYNPRDLAENIRRLIAGEAIEPLVPWFKNFTGTITQIEPLRYVTRGIANVVDEQSLEITELPIKSWTSNYKESVLEMLLNGSDKVKPCITDYRDSGTDQTVKFAVTMDEAELASAEQEGLTKKFKLESNVNCTSMVLFDAAGVLRKYDSAESILQDFFDVRLQKYRERKDYLKGMLEAEASKLDNQARFILEKIEGTIAIENRSKRDVITTLVQSGYMSDPVKAWKTTQTKPTDNDSEAGSVVSTEGGPDFNYILNMNLWSLSKEKKEELLAQRDQKKNEFNILLKKSPEDLWIEDLDVFLEELDRVEAFEREEDLQTQKNCATAKGKNSAATKGKAKKRPVKKEPVVQKEPVVKKEPAVQKSKDKSEATSKKTAKKASPPVVEIKEEKEASNDGSVVDDSPKEVMSLADRLAARKGPVAKKQSKLSFEAPKKKPTQLLRMPDSSEDEKLSFSEDDGDFVPQKKKKAEVSSKVKPSLAFIDDDSESDNSEVERTKALIEKLTPVKQKKGSSDNDSDVSTKAKRNLLEVESEIGSDISINEDKSSPPVKMKEPEKKPVAAKGRGKKVVRAANQMTLFSSTAKATEKKKPSLLASSDDQDALPTKKTTMAPAKAKPASKSAPTKRAPTKRAPKKKLPSLSSDDDEPAVAKKQSKASKPLSKKMKIFDDSDNEDSFSFNEIPAEQEDLARQTRVRKGKAKYRFEDSDESDKEPVEKEDVSAVDLSVGVSDDEDSDF